MRLIEFSSRCLFAFLASSHIGICCDSCSGFDKRLWLNVMYSDFRSNPTQLRSQSCAATNVLPLPANGSNTSSPACVNNSMHLLGKDIGNVAG